MPRLLTDLREIDDSLLHGAVSVGNFDGVHRGHARLIERLVAAGARHGGPAIVMTFDPPPSAVLFPDRPYGPALTSIPRRAELLFALGVEALIAVPTDKHLLALTADEFFADTVVQRLQARAMVEGPNFRFGRDRGGDVLRLQQLCTAAQVDFEVVTPVEDAQGMISSTRIRQCLAAGDVRLANRLLTQAYTLSGRVVPGAQRGAALGFPTANLTEIDCMLPSPGVYAGHVELSDPLPVGEFPVALNIGPNLTFEESQTKVEAHIIGYAGGPLYGRRLRIALLDKIRDIRKFDSLEQLRTQIAHDVAACANYR